MSSNIQITENGIVIPQTSEIKQEFQSVFIDAFGSDINLDDATPQGVIIDDLTQQKQMANTVDLVLFNQMNPATADGVFQDAIANLYFVQRKAATNSIVTCRCVGVPNTVLGGVSQTINDSPNPYYSQTPVEVQSLGGDIFECLVGGVIPSTGYIDLVFRAKDTGAIAVGANTVNRIYKPVGGLDSVNNTNAGTVGDYVESRADFEKRRKESLALNATGSLASVKAKLLNTTGVSDVFVWENDKDTSQTYRGITMGAHSIYTCIKGGSSDDIAEAIYNSKSAGCDTNGSNIATYIEPTTGVEYEYKYYIPTETPYYIQVNLDSGITEAQKEIIRNAIKENWDGVANDNDTKITIGDTVYGSRFNAVVNRLNLAGVLVNSVKVGTNGSTWADKVTCNMNILPTLTNNSTYIVFTV